MAGLTANGVLSPEALSSSYFNSWMGSESNEDTEEGWGCSVQGLGVANYGGMKGVYLVGDWCSGRLFALGWD
ncbi:hypothetical protein MYX75_10190 [Acidobacteria bacterium AH-259-A15]|nr:hypothetical protein [Acidobacteria bacterium AH-259-A15]